MNFMKVIFEDSKKILLRLDTGEEIIKSLIEFFGGKEVSASFTALGAVAWAELAFYDRTLKQYTKRRAEEDMEILNVTGNIAWLSNQPVVHAHGTFGRKDFSVIGGHVISAEVSATCEIHLRLLPRRIEREPDKEKNLNLLAP